MITAMGDALDEDLALAGGELTWLAGPLAKGGGLCHGTAGNGYAFLELLRRTGDELWLDRARAFAAHAIGQVQGRYSLWTGTSGSRSTSPTAWRAAAAYRFRSSQSAARTTNASRTGSIAGFQVTSPFLIT